MILADTNFFIALAQSNDELSPRAYQWLAVVKEPIVVAEAVIWEVFDSLSHTGDRVKAHFLFAQLTTKESYRLIPNSQELFQNAVQLHAKRSDKHWSLTDCASFVIMSELKITRALTHDHHFEQAGFEALLRRDP
jgi:predicted nucleic acid-binding protein